MAPQKDPTWVTDPNQSRWREVAPLRNKSAKETFAHVVKNI